MRSRIEAPIQLPHGYRLRVEDAVYGTELLVSRGRLHELQRAEGVRQRLVGARLAAHGGAHQHEPMSNQHHLVNLRRCIII